MNKPRSRPAARPAAFGPHSRAPRRTRTARSAEAGDEDFRGGEGEAATERGVHAGRLAAGRGALPARTPTAGKTSPSSNTLQVGTAAVRQDTGAEFTDDGERLRRLGQPVAADHRAGSAVGLASIAYPWSPARGGPVRPRNLSRTRRPGLSRLVSAELRQGNPEGSRPH